MRPRTQKQPQVKKELCRVLDEVDVDVDDGLMEPIRKLENHYHELKIY